MLGGGAYSTTTQGIVENIDETPQIKYYNYAPSTIKVQRGSDTINFNYTPSVDTTAITTSVEEYVFPTSTNIDPKYVKNIDARAGQTIAYEYIFGNAMNRSAAVNLKSIGDTTGVTVSYLWRTSPLTQGEAVTNSPTKFTCQEMANKDDTIYLYVIVSSESASIPVDFTTKIKWYYGVPYDLTFTNNATGTTDTVKLVKNQEIDETVLEIPSGYYFDAWFKDSRYSKLASASEIKAGAKLYPRYHNVPFGTSTNPTTYMTYNASTGYSVTNGGQILSVTKYNPIIPTYYNDGTNGRKLVTSIGSSAFYDMYIESISVPKSITSIESGAFMYYNRGDIIDLSGCANLTIKSAAFGSSSLTSVDLSGCTNLTIESQAFYLSHINKITIPKGLISMGYDAFYVLGSVTVEEGNPVYDSRNNCNAIIETATNTLIRGCNTTIIPNTVTSIGANAFDGCSSLTSITIPASVTSIGDGAFVGCSSLTSVDLSNCTNLVSIGDGAFSICNYLNDIDLSGCTNLVSIGCGVFDYSNVTSITIPSSVTSIGWFDGEGSGSFTSVVFQDSTTWYRTKDAANWKNKTGGTQTDVTNGSTIANYLKSGYYFYKL